MRLRIEIGLVGVLEVAASLILACAQLLEVGLTDRTNKKVVSGR